MLNSEDNNEANGDDNRENSSRLILSSKCLSTNTVEFNKDERIWIWLAECKCIKYDVVKINY